MGYSATALTIVGIKFHEDELRKTEKHPGCDHNHRTKYCPECGAPKEIEINVDVRDKLESYDDDNNCLFSISSEIPPNIIGTAIGWHGQYSDPSEPISIGELHAHIEGCKNGIRGVLEPLGLWDETRLAIHTIKYESV